METFSALLAICAGNSPVPGEFHAQRPVTRSFDVFFDLRLNKRLNKQSWGWWFETLLHSLWRHRNVLPKWYYFWPEFLLSSTSTVSKISPSAVVVCVTVTQTPVICSTPKTLSDSCVAASTTHVAHSVKHVVPGLFRNHGNQPQSVTWIFVRVSKLR